MALIGNNNHKSVLDENASLFQNTEKKSEKQKWAEMNNSQKLHYFIDYYLLKCIFTAAIAAVSILFIWNILKPQKEQKLFLAVVHNSLISEDEERLDQVLTELLVTDSETQEIHIDDSFAEGHATDAKLSAYLAAQEIDLLITYETHFQELAKTGCFEDLNNVISEIDSQNKDLFCWSSVSADSDSEHTGAYGIDITNSEFLKNSWYSEEKAIIGIIQGSMKKENAILTLSELFFNHP